MRPQGEGEGEGEGEGDGEGEGEVPLTGSMRRPPMRLMMVSSSTSMKRK